MRSLQRIILVSLACAGWMACAGPASQTGWREQPTLSPGWTRVRHAAASSLRSPKTWAPLALAAALQIDHLDDRISDWAMEETPLFGSTDRAGSFSSFVETAMHSTYVVSLIATPVEERGRDWWLLKTKTLSIGLAGNLVQQQSVEALKSATGRSRPIGGRTGGGVGGLAGVPREPDQLRDSPRVPSDEPGRSAQVGRAVGMGEPEDGVVDNAVRGPVADGADHRPRATELLAHGGEGRGRDAEQIGILMLADHQCMAARARVDIHEGQRLVILVHFQRGDLAADDT